MLSVDAEYAHVSAITKYKSDLIHGAFDQFIKIFTAIVGGSIWLSRQSDVLGVSRENYQVLSNATVAVLVIYGVVSVFDDFRSWWGYRVRLTEIGRHGSVDPQISPPKVWPAVLKPTAMAFAMVTALYFFVEFNPFS